MPGDSVIELRPLRFGQGHRVRFEALPHRIQQLGLLGWREAVDLASQMVHLPTISRTKLMAHKSTRIAVASRHKLEIP